MARVREPHLRPAMTSGQVSWLPSSALWAGAGDTASSPAAQLVWGSLPPQPWAGSEDRGSVLWSGDLLGDTLRTQVALAYTWNWEAGPSRAQLLGLPPRLAHQGLGWQRGPPCWYGRGFSGSSWVSCSGRTDMKETGRKSWGWLLCIPSLGLLLPDLRTLCSPTLEGISAPEDTSQRRGKVAPD